MSDNAQATHPPHPSTPPEFYTPPPPPGDPPMTAPTTTQHLDQTATQPLLESSQQPPQQAPAYLAATNPPSQPSVDPFNDTHQSTAAPAQPDPFQEPPQHSNRPPPVGPVTETPLHSEPVPILPPRPQAQPELPAPPPPRASFDQIPDHPAMRQSSLGHPQFPDPSVQRVAMTPVQPQPLAPPPQAPVLNANAASLESDPAIASLHAMFPDFDLLVLQSVLEATGGNKDQAVDSLLSMSDPDYAPPQQQQQQPPTGGGAPNQGRQPTQTELDEEFARRLMFEEEQQAHGGAWPPRDQQSSQYSGTVPYQQYQSRRSGEQQRPAAAGGGIGEVAGDLQQQFKNFIGGAGGSSGRRQGQSQGQGSGGAGYQDQLNKFADTGKKTLTSIFSKVKQKMEEFDGKHPSDTQNMNQPPQSGHWSNWQAPNPNQQQQQAPTYAQSPAPAPAQHVSNAQSPPPFTQHGALNNNPYTMPSTNADPNAALPASSGRWQYQPEPAAPAPPQAPLAGASAAEEPRRSVDTSRLGLLPKRPVSLMDTNANTRQAAAPAPAAAHERTRDSDEESLEYVDRPMPGSMGRS